MVMHGTPSKLRFRYVLDDIVLSVLADGGLPVVGTPAAEGLCDTARLALAPMSLPPILGPPPLPVE